MSTRTQSAGSTATQTSTGKTPQGMPSSVPHEKVAMRAYQKWVHRGCPSGTDQQDWLEAEAELKAEMSRGGNPSPSRK